MLMLLTDAPAPMGAYLFWIMCTEAVVVCFPCAGVCADAAAVARVRVGVPLPGQARRRDHPCRRGGRRRDAAQLRRRRSRRRGRPVQLMLLANA